ncbi:MAG: DNA-processing protein DprA [Gordonia sp. (in: high G+C Gram-positive bacteria)]|uniref:DNA-processing protein DprA n=1 Tax=Gordonia sp. (in: high G+C Gram-positive bacteria) TaxID=84139 RepID=UPI0039E3910E
MSGSDEVTRRAWAYLSRVAEPPHTALREFVEAEGPVDAAAAIRSRNVPAGYAGLSSATQARARVDRGAEDLEAAAAIGARLVTPDDDDEWPGWQLWGLRAADTVERGGPPLALWVRGTRCLADEVRAGIGVVGARGSTSYGEHVTGQLVGGVVEHGWSVISGGAFGIDGTAHRAALGSGGSTIAVMACGIDVDYPASHTALFTAIARDGLIVTEYPPGTTAARHRFLTRNRLVAALATAVVVVEAGRRSGAANTAAWARKLGRPLGAVPGPVTSAMSVGCNRMIADEQAALITDAASLISLAAPDGAGGPNGGPVRKVDALSGDRSRVYEAIPGSGALAVEELVLRAGIDSGRVLAALAMLEVDGFIVAAGEGWSLNRG